jgi:hypothetical protein
MLGHLNNLNKRPESTGVQSCGFQLWVCIIFMAGWFRFANGIRVLLLRTQTAVVWAKYVEVISLLVAARK